MKEYKPVENSRVCLQGGGFLIGNLGGVLGILFSITIFILLFIGLWISRKKSFKPGVYFFVLLIIHQIYSYIAPQFIRNYIDKVASENIGLWFDMTIGQLVAWFSLIPKTIELAAFIFLVAGLYQLKFFRDFSK